MNAPIITGVIFTSAAQVVGVALWQLGFIASLAFMWSVRNPKSE